MKYFLVGFGSDFWIEVKMPRRIGSNAFAIVESKSLILFSPTFHSNL